MKFKKYIILSFIVHVLAIGAGLAFARWTSVSLRHGEPVTVMLIGKEAGAGSTPGKKARTRDTTKKAETKHSPVEKASIPAEEASALQQDVRTGLQQSGTMPEASDRPVSEEANNAGSGQAESNGSAQVSSQQWTVIVSSIERVKSYPRLARERGIEGVVRLRFRLKPEGEVDKVEIVKSSGFDILDLASVKTLYKAGPLPYVSGWLEVPMAYVLK